MRTDVSFLSTGLPRPLWTALLVTASLGLTLGFACAVPFAAFASIAALTMPRRDALLAVGLVWLANQVVGFAVLHYPFDAETLAWGAALLGVALAAALSAHAFAARFLALPRLGLALLAFLPAFAAYEGLLFIISMAAQSGVEDYTLAIVARILALNAAAFLGLLTVSRLSAAFTIRPGAARHTLPAREA